jgi:sarcosine oxidase
MGIVIINFILLSNVLTCKKAESLNNSFDIIIIGAGAFGSSAAYHLSKSTKKVLVIDRDSPPHAFGSSHGQTRIIREAYFEDPIYVPMLREAYSLWDELERESEEKLFLKTGGLMLGNKESHVIQGTLNSAQTFKIEHEVLDNQSIKNKFSSFNADKQTMGVYEQNAGILFPEKCIKTTLKLAKQHGVDLNFNETVLSIEYNSNSVEIITNKGSYLSQKCILAAGPWMNKLITELKIPLQTTRQVLYWYDIDKKITNYPSNDKFPIFIWNTESGKHFYGFPDIGNGFKIAFHDKGELCDPDNINRSISAQEIEEMNHIIHSYFNFKASFKEAVTCIYTNTPDDHFIIDRHPLSDNVIIASPCSGHGFKFSSVIGKILSDMALDKLNEFNLSPFELNRFII